ncbi:MAG: DUF3108 domain-containing protein [Deltaproteobacteria bacterium]|nr:DUF3108 domain-containing protein [Deltaproteobacteria bacterium]
MARRTPTGSLFLALTPVLIFTALLGSVFGETNRFPFHPGEQMKFQVHWTIIPAGEVVLEVMPLETLSGVRCYRFAMTARTSEAIDVFYKIRDRIDAYADTDMTRSLLYRKRQEGRTRRDIVVQFDWAKGETRYRNFDEERDPVPLLPGSFDPLSIFYAFRAHGLTDGKDIHVPVTDGKRCVLGRTKIIGREKVEVPAGTYETFLVETEMKDVGGVFEKTPKAGLRIWVTADEDRIPVRVKSRVKVGSFTAELVSWKKGRTTSASRR